MNREDAVRMRDAFGRCREVPDRINYDFVGPLSYEQAFCFPRDAGRRAGEIRYLYRQSNESPR